MIAILPPKKDEVFKMLFGDEQNTDVLTDFLRAVLPLSDDDYESLTLKNPCLPSEILNDKNGILDVLAQTKSGRRIDIEIQVAPQTAFKSRVLYYLACLFTRQIGEGDSYRLLKPAIGIVITDFVWIADSALYHNAYRLYDPKSGSLFSDDLSLHTLELPKAGKDDHTDLWAWLEFLKAQDKEGLEMLAKEHLAVQPAAKKLIRLSENTEAWLVHEAREKARRDAQSLQEDAKEKGREEGRDEEKLAIARNLLKIDLPVEKIIEVTGLSVAEIQSLYVH
jgi:predicted transposase/invertase (TIGR01784 family)